MDPSSQCYHLDIWPFANLSLCSIVRQEWKRGVYKSILKPWSLLFLLSRNFFLIAALEIQVVFTNPFVKPFMYIECEEEFYIYIYSIYVYYIHIFVWSKHTSFADFFLNIFEYALFYSRTDSWMDRPPTEAEAEVITTNFPRKSEFTFAIFVVIQKNHTLSLMK